MNPYTQEEKKIVKIPIFNRKIIEDYCNTIFDRDINYIKLKEYLKIFLLEANPKIYTPCSIPALIDEEELKRKLEIEKERRKRKNKITLIGYFIIFLWKLDYLIIPSIINKIKSGVKFFKSFLRL